MKLFITLIAVGLFLLSACTTAGTDSQTAGSDGQEAATAQPEQTEAPSTTPAVPKSLSDVLEEQAPTASEDVNSPAPALDWDPDPQALIASATNCCGFVPELVKINYIPEAQIWGDGRIVWVLFTADNRRQVLEGKLSTEQTAEFLQRAADAGFFGWDELYSDPMAPTDLPSKCVFIQVESESRNVCEYYKGAPQPFHDLYNDLTGGLGAAGQEFTPERAYLVSYPAGEAGSDPGQEGLPTWDAAAAGLSLAEATEGLWIEGPALEQAWALVTANAVPAVVEEDALYQLSVQVPGLSQVAPPPQN